MAQEGSLGLPGPWFCLAYSTLIELLLLAGWLTRPGVTVVGERIWFLPSAASSLVLGGSEASPLLPRPPLPFFSPNLKRMQGACVSADLSEAESPAAPVWLLRGLASLGYPSYSLPEEAPSMCGRPCWPQGCGRQDLPGLGERWEGSHHRWTLISPPCF